MSALGLDPAGHVIPPAVRRQRRRAFPNAPWPGWRSGKGAHSPSGVRANHPRAPSLSHILARRWCRKPVRPRRARAGSAAFPLGRHVQLPAFRLGGCVRGCLLASGSARTAEAQGAQCEQDRHETDDEVDAGEGEFHADAEGQERRARAVAAEGVDEERLLCPDPAGADRHDPARLSAACTSSTLRADCSIRNAPSMNQTVARRSAHSASCQATTVRSHRAGVRTTVNACRTRCLNSATLARIQTARAMTPKTSDDEHDLGGSRVAKEPREVEARQVREHVEAGQDALRDRPGEERDSRRAHRRSPARGSS